ncbi:MAG TPA: alpha/beta fold hydrolase [Micromonosporaceae bacterium]
MLDTGQHRPMSESAPVQRWVPAPSGDVSQAVLRLFTFAHAGGGAAFFRPWRSALAPRIDVRPVLLPGRESRIRELPYRRMEQLLDPLCAALEPYLDLPYAFFGHSMGSIVAYEVARRFSARAAVGPVCVLVSGRRAPRLPATRRLFCTLSDDEFTAEVGRLNGTPPEVLGQPELLRLLLPALRADFELNEMYQPLPGRGLRCPLVAYLGVDDPEADPPELLAWRSETSGEFVLRLFSGDHFYLRNGRPDVLSAVRADLDRALQLAGIHG